MQWQAHSDGPRNVAPDFDGRVIPVDQVRDRELDKRGHVFNFSFQQFRCIDRNFLGNRTSWFDFRECYCVAACLPFYDGATSSDQRV